MTDRKLKLKLWRFVIIMLVQIYRKLYGSICIFLKADFDELLAEIDLKIREETDEKITSFK